MRAARLTSAIMAASLASTAASQSIMQIADIPYYSSLAPCAMSAVSYAVNYLTNSQCPEGTAFQSCACTKQGNSADVQASITSNAKYTCGATATEDFSSASLVFAQYCNQASGFSTPSPGNTQVSMPITDVPYFADLAPCAASAVSYAVGTMTNYLCQEGVPQLNYCACTKNQNSFAVSSMIQSNVQYSCGATHSADITSALALFAGWCQMADGTTAFPSTSDLGGALSYYITDLPDFSSLAKCAMSAVSYGVLTMTNELCPEYPGALASCVCAKDGNSGLVSSMITSNVKYSCDNTATEDVTSAMAVFEQYCKAAKGEVKPAGITASVPQKTSTANSGSAAAASPSPTAKPSTNQAPRTSSPPSTSTAADGSLVVIPGTTDTSSSPSDTTKSGMSPGAIGGMAGGIVAGVVALAALAWFLYRRHKRNKQAAYRDAVLAAADEEEKGAGRGAGVGAGAGGAGLYKGANADASELHHDEAAGGGVSPVSAGSSPRPVGSELEGSPKAGVVRKPVATPPVGGSELGGTPRGGGNELAGSPRVHGNELAGNGGAARGNELPGSGYGGQRAGVHEAAGDGQVYEAPGFGNQRYEGQQMYGNNAGPVYEMPGHGQGGGWQHGGQR